MSAEFQPFKMREDVRVRKDRLDVIVRVSISVNDLSLANDDEVHGGDPRKMSCVHEILDGVCTTPIEVYIKFLNICQVDAFSYASSVSVIAQVSFNENFLRDGQDERNEARPTASNGL